LLSIFATFLPFAYYILAMGATAGKTIQNVERTASKTKQFCRQALKESLSCLVPFRSMSRRCPQSAPPPGDPADPRPHNDDIREDRPLLKHRAAAGFVVCTQGFGGQLRQKSREVSSKLRGRAKSFGSGMASIPTPMRHRRSGAGNYTETDIDPLFGSALDDIWVIGSDDDGEIGADDQEQQPFMTHAIRDGRVGRTSAQPLPSRNPKVPSLTTKIGNAKLVCPNTFYVGTPRDCQ